MNSPRRRTKLSPGLESLDDRIMPSPAGAGLPVQGRAAQVSVAARRTNGAARRTALRAQRQGAAAAAATARFQGTIRPAATPAATPAGPPSTGFYYNSAVSPDGSEVIARDAPAGGGTSAPAATTNLTPDSTPGRPAPGFYYNSAENPDGSQVIARSGGFAPEGQPIPGGSGQVYGTAPADPSGAPVNSFAPEGQPIPGGSGQVYGTAPADPSGAPVNS